MKVIKDFKNISKKVIEQIELELEVTLSCFLLSDVTYCPTHERCRIRIWALAGKYDEPHVDVVSDGEFFTEEDLRENIIRIKKGWRALFTPMPY